MKLKSDHGCGTGIAWHYRSIYDQQLQCSVFHVLSGTEGTADDRSHWIYRLRSWNLRRVYKKQ